LVSNKVLSLIHQITNKNSIKMNARQKRIEKLGYKITWFVNNGFYKLVATKNGRSIKATSITNLYNQLFN